MQPSLHALRTLGKIKIWVLTNYIKTSFRNLFRNRLYAALNIGGLSIAFASVILIGIYAGFESSFESFHSKNKAIYRPTYKYRASNGFEVHWARIPVDYINQLPNEFPEVERLIRFQNHERKYIKVGQEKFNADDAFTTDKDVFDVFDFRLIYGDPKTALDHPHAAVISASEALKLFGSTAVLGKEFSVTGDWNEEERRYTITGVMEDLPANTHLPVRVLFSYSNQDERSGWAYVYILLNKEAEIQQLAEKMPDFIKKYRESDDGGKVEFEFQPLKAIHLDSNLAREIIPNSKRSYLTTFLFIGLFILMASLFNFINLFSTQVTERSGEMGIRKILGAGSMEVSGIIFFESVMYHMLALAIGALLAFFAFPFVRTLTVIHFVQHVPTFVIQAVALAVMMGVLGGVAAALITGKLEPAKVLKGPGQISVGGRKGILRGRKVLIAMQFALSLLLIGSAFVARQQFRYMNEKNLGISPEQVMVITGIPNKVTQKYNSFKSGISSISQVLTVAGCMEVPSREIRDSGPVLIRGINEDEETAPVIDVQIIDEEFLDLLGIEVLAGRNISIKARHMNYPEFSESLSPTDYFKQAERDYLINETAMKDLGWDNPKEAIGQYINWQINPYELAMGPVVGIIPDYHQESLKNRIDPLVMFYEPLWIRTILVKLDTEHLDQTIGEIKSVWDRMFPAYPMNYSFLDDMYNSLYKVDRAKLNLLFLLAGLAVFNGFLGLFAIVAYTLNLRIKEMTIRKLIGARDWDLLILVARDYVMYLIGASLMAVPLSYYWVNRWLESFSYRISISGLYYLLAFLLILVMVIMTVGYHIYRLHRLNLSELLKAE